MPRKPSPLPEVAVLQYVVADGKRLNIGQFPTKEEAQAALNPIRAELHGEYARAS